MAQEVSPGAVDPGPPVNDWVAMTQRKNPPSPRNPRIPAPSRPTALTLLRDGGRSTRHRGVEEHPDQAGGPARPRPDAHCAAEEPPSHPPGHEQDEPCRHSTGQTRGPGANGRAKATAARPARARQSAARDEWLPPEDQHSCGAHAQEPDVEPRHRDPRLPLSEDACAQAEPGPPPSIASDAGRASALIEGPTAQHHDTPIGSARRMCEGFHAN